MEKQEYALGALKLAKENHISINGFATKTDKFYTELGKLVFDIADNRRKLDIYSFGNNSTMKIPGKTSFIEINIS